MVVSAEGKGPARLGQVSGKTRTARKPLLKCRKQRDDVETGALSLLRDKLRRSIWTLGFFEAMLGQLDDSRQYSQNAEKLSFPIAELSSGLATSVVGIV
jgi:hypothetical protein